VVKTTGRKSAGTRAPSRQPLADTDQVAEFLGVSAVTLAQWRYRGCGPTFVHAGQFVRYRWADVDKWLEGSAKQRTGDRGVPGAA